MKVWQYFDQPHNKAFHNLTLDNVGRNDVKQLLGMGLKFIPTPFFTNNNLHESRRRLIRHMKLHAYYKGADTMKQKSKKDMKIYVRSTWTPKEWMIPGETTYRGHKFFNQLSELFRKKRGRNNLLPLQRRALNHLRKQDQVIVVQCDKNMGPAIIERRRYIKIVLEHLSQRRYYEQLNYGDIQQHTTEIVDKLKGWTDKYIMELTEPQRKYMMQSTEEEMRSLPYFYVMMKIHKERMGVRPITACCGTILYRLGIVVDMWLQRVATTFDSYIKNSKEFKDKLLSLPRVRGTRIFTADARAMYTNIDTGAALEEIKTFLFFNQSKFPGLPVGAVMAGLKIIMENNYFTFGNTLWRQVNGAAMGQPPSPSYATIFFGIHERKIIPRLKQMKSLLYYFRYLDDVFGGWDPNTDVNNQRWVSLQKDMNDFHGLEWDFSEQEENINFLDIKVSINSAGRVSTDLFEKDLNPYLYITPNSSHPPGVLLGLILGNCHRIFTLVSSKTDRRKHFNQFLRRLLSRGYTRRQVMPIFQRAAAKEHDRRNHELMVERALDPDKPKTLFFHLRYHPNDPPSRVIQEHWKDIVTEPPNGKKYEDIKNNRGHELGKTRLIVAYRRPPNLGNLLSSKIIQKTEGPPVSSYMD